MSRDIPFTSRQAYEHITANGLLSKSCYAVYDLLFREGPLTGRDVDDALGPDAHKRLSELEEQGVIAKVGTRTCAKTGQDGYLWEVTGQLPVPRNKSVKQYLTGTAKAVAEIKSAIPQRRRSPELVALLDRLDAELASNSASWSNGRARVF